MSDFIKKTEDEKDEVAAGGEDDNEKVTEEESTATFVPVVQLEAVEVKTYEEDEDVLYKQRSKLFTYGETLLDKGTGNKSWKERGIGEMKLLKHKQNGRIRILMRQEKTMKVIANHFCDPRIVLTPNAASDRSWVWVAFDFAENELVETTFALKFGTPELAATFKAEVTKAQEEMDKLLNGKDSEDGVKESDDAAKALESLKIEGETEKVLEKEPEGK